MYAPWNLENIRKSTNNLSILCQFFINEITASDAGPDIIRSHLFLGYFRVLCPSFDGIPNTTIIKFQFYYKYTAFNTSLNCIESNVSAEGWTITAFPSVKKRRDNCRELLLLI